MQEAINTQIVDRLIEDYLFVVKGEHLREGRCPDCKKKSLWTWVDTPGRVQCNRTTDCAWSSTSKHLFPDLFENLNKRHPATEKKPNATADSYLMLIRGFDLSKIHGWYKQGKYWNPNGDKGTATVRFYLDAERTVYWERFIDEVTVTDDDGDTKIRKNRFKGALRGLWWQPPGFEVLEGERVWLCEGIMDAMALNLSGIKAVSIMSSGTFPDKKIEELKGRGIIWVMALDNDKSGRTFMHKHAKKLRALGETVEAALSSESSAKEDWNDLHKKGKLTAEDIKRYLHFGALEMASSAAGKALELWQWNRKKAFFVFTFWARTYSFRIDAEEYGKAREKIQDSADAQDEEIPMEAFRHASTIREIATFRMEFLYFEEPADGEDGLYFFRMAFSNRAPEVQIAFGHRIFGAAGDFKKSVAQRPGALFTGTTPDLDLMYKGWFDQTPKIVKTLDYVGYDKDSGVYVYPQFAVDNGRILDLNSESFFQLQKSGIKTKADIKQKLVKPKSLDWFSDFHTAYGVGGLVALSWWFGCLFVEQIRQRYRNYPFFELVGEAGSGKTDMVDFMWKLLGKEADSFNPNSSTLPGRIRKMAEVSNLPVVFNETDNDDPTQQRHTKRFVWDENKSLYDGEFDRVTGIKSQGNTNRKPAFKAGLMIVQNVPVLASDAILSRIVHLQHDRHHHSPAGKQASDQLNRLSITDVSGFLLHAVSQAEHVLKKFSSVYLEHQKRLQADATIKLQRVVENHAKIMALADCLGLVLPIPRADIGGIHDALVTMAGTRQAAMDEDHPIVQKFWDTFDYMNSRPATERGNFAPVIEDDLMNHSNDPGAEIAVNLDHFNRRCGEMKLKMDYSDLELRRHLKTSRKRVFVENRVVRSRIERRALRCWIFKSGGL